MLLILKSESGCQNTVTFPSLKSESGSEPPVTVTVILSSHADKDK